MTKFKFVVATAKSEGEILPIHKSLDRMKYIDGIEVITKIYWNNSDGLPKVYNTALDELEDDIDYVIFVHDDIWINDVFIFDKIMNMPHTVGLIGVCGGKTWDATKEDINAQRPIAWTYATRNHGASGFMIHMVKENDKTQLFASSYGLSPSTVATIDGCFMCFSKDAIDKKLRFDERFKFHYYDMDISVAAFKKDISISTVPVLLTHESVGNSMFSPSFMEAQNLFCKKWWPQS